MLFIHESWRRARICLKMRGSCLSGLLVWAGLRAAGMWAVFFWIIEIAALFCMKWDLLHFTGVNFYKSMSNTEKPIVQQDFGFISVLKWVEQRHIWIIIIKSYMRAEYNTDPSFFTLLIHSFIQCQQQEWCYHQVSQVHLRLWAGQY